MSGSFLTISNTFRQFPDLNLITPEAHYGKVIFGCSAVTWHNLAFYEAIMFDGLVILFTNEVMRLVSYGTL